MKILSGFTFKTEQILKKGGTGIIPTDTIYGIVGSALSPKAVNRIYRLRHRRPDKPMIILISSLNDLKIFGIKIDNKVQKMLKKLWPGKVSVILRVKSHESRVKLKYLHRGTKALAFRLPASKALHAFLKKTGPLVAPSANFEDRPLAKTIREAKNYFGERVDFYVDGGRLVSKPSTLIELKKGRIVVLRKGTVPIKK